MLEEGDKLALEMATLGVGGCSVISVIGIALVTGARNIEIGADSVTWSTDEVTQERPPTRS